MKGFINRTDLAVMAEKAVAYWGQAVHDYREGLILRATGVVRCRTFPIFGRKIYFTEQEVRDVCTGRGIEHEHRLFWTRHWYCRADGMRKYLERAEKLLASAECALPRRYILDEKDLDVIRVVLDKAE